ncbi:MAG: hypothetical protein LBQ68_09665 [Clostridiales bacterium]|nr:hypothetical protein [Clostridiales bacterium]
MVKLELNRAKALGLNEAELDLTESDYEIYNCKEITFIDIDVENIDFKKVNQEDSTTESVLAGSFENQKGENGPKINADSNIEPSLAAKKKKKVQVSKLLRYLRRNIEHVNYRYLKRKGYVIGSGGVESGNKLVLQSRLKLSGMHWKLANAQRVVSLKSRYEANQWDDYVKKTTIDVLETEYELINFDFCGLSINKTELACLIKGWDKYYKGK